MSPRLGYGGFFSQSSWNPQLWDSWSSKFDWICWSIDLFVEFQPVTRSSAYNIRVTTICREVVVMVGQIVDILPWIGWGVPSWRTRNPRTAAPTGQDLSAFLMWEAAPCVALQFLPDGFLACALTDGTVGSLVWKTREPEKLELQVEQSELLTEKIGSSIWVNLCKAQGRAGGIWCQPKSGTLLSSLSLLCQDPLLWHQNVRSGVQGGDSNASRMQRKATDWLVLMAGCKQ